MKIYYVFILLFFYLTKIQELKASKDETKELKSKIIQKEEERKKKSLKDKKSTFLIFFGCLLYLKIIKYDNTFHENLLCIPSQ